LRMAIVEKHQWLLTRLQSFTQSDTTAHLGTASFCNPN
jgi:hypothetical protein